MSTHMHYKKDSIAAMSQTTYQTAYPEFLAGAILSWHNYLLLLPKLGRLKQDWNMPVEDCLSKLIHMHTTFIHN